MPLAPRVVLSLNHCEKDSTLTSEGPRRCDEIRRYDCSFVFTITLPPLIVIFLLTETFDESCELNEDDDVPFGTFISRMGLENTSISRMGL